MGNIGQVPCGSCTACCRNELIVLHPEDGDVPAHYTTVRTLQPATGQMVHAIPLRPDGACIYLGEAGCTIHDRRPAVCRSFDCRLMMRGLAQHMSRADRRRAMREKHHGAEVMRAGHERQDTLVATDDEVEKHRSYYEVLLAEER